MFKCHETISLSCKHGKVRSRSLIGRRLLSSYPKHNQKNLFAISAAQNSYESFLSLRS